MRSRPSRAAVAAGRAAVLASVVAAALSSGAARAADPGPLTI